MFYYYVTKVLPVEGDELRVGDTYPDGGSGEIITIVAITEPNENGDREEFDLITTRHTEGAAGLAAHLLNELNVDNK